MRPKFAYYIRAPLGVIVCIAGLLLLVLEPLEFRLWPFVLFGLGLIALSAAAARGGSESSWSELANIYFTNKTTEALRTRDKALMRTGLLILALIPVWGVLQLVVLRESTPVHAMIGSAFCLSVFAVVCFWRVAIKVSIMARGAAGKRGGGGA